ncbi:hypothetical protein M378DRAFT_622567 [Amanita muscaria Koide BX008]|uniref:Uncharacterized protein n=1 Tax=Amanita muscaria (strain Koide BX008) TaxID=946122 RepID=A0A0C2T3H9_AMAMK|nr:hypothetical protein M378DRAFT_622567 [Amanita muscaria Koide BX008]
MVSNAWMKRSSLCRISYNMGGHSMCLWSSGALLLWCACRLKPWHIYSVLPMDVGFELHPQKWQSRSLSRRHGSYAFQKSQEIWSFVIMSAAFGLSFDSDDNILHLGHSISVKHVEWMV